MATWKPFVKRGTDTVLSEISDSTFEDIATEHNKKIKDLKFSPDLTDITWSSTNKSSTPTWSGTNKN